MNDGGRLAPPCLAARRVVHCADESVDCAAGARGERRRRCIATQSCIEIRIVWKTTCSASTLAARFSACLTTFASEL